MCDGIRWLLRGVCGVCSDRSLLVDLLRKENEAVTRRESLCVALQGCQITISIELYCVLFLSYSMPWPLFPSLSDCSFLSHYSRPVVRL